MADAPVTLTMYNGQHKEIGEAMLWLELCVHGKARHVRIGQGVAGRAQPVRLRGWAVLGSGIPLAMLGYWLSVGSSAALPVAVISKALLTSLPASLGGASFCVLLVLPISFLVVRYKGRLAIWPERLPYLLHAYQPQQENGTVDTKP